jgi:Alcohol dehydrogenase GroES-associated
MKTLCWHGKGDMRYETVPDPKIEDPRDVIDAVGTEPHSTASFDSVVDRIKVVATFMGTDRPHVLRQAIHCCRTLAQCPLSASTAASWIRFRCVSSGAKIDKNHRYKIRQADTLSFRPAKLAAVLGPIKAKP